MDALNYKYFHLNNECYLVLGEKKSTINNIIKKEIIWLDEEQTQLAIKSENGEKVDSDNDFLNNLSDAGWGFFSERKYFIDKIRTKNLFSQNMFYKERPTVYSCTLHITNNCNLSCYQCGNIFCPSCIKYSDESIPDLNQLKSTIQELLPYGLQEIVLVGGEVALYSDLEKLLDYCSENGLRTIINTNGTIHIPNKNNTQYILNIFTNEQLVLAQKNYENQDNFFVVLHDIKNTAQIINNTWTVIEKSTSIPEITLATMRKLGVLEFNVSKYLNMCLSNRIHIMNNMDVITCLGKTELVGNLKKDSLSSILLSLYENQWKDTKVSDNESGCGACEFRYSCNPCILTREKKCNI